MDSFVPLSVPNLSGNECKYVNEAVESEWVSSAGAQIGKFESMLGDYVGADYACACQSGTAGLHLCLIHYGIGPGDIVLVPTLTFIATINPILYQNAKPVFFDCDDNLCMNLAQVREYIEKACSYDGSRLIEKKSGSTVKAIIPVHVFGDICDMEAVTQIAAQYNLVVIEDATESLGGSISKGKYKGRHTGTVGHAGVFSFNGNKIITTGGGGMVVSNDKAAVDHMRYLSQQSKDDTLYFIHNEVGYNYRMTNLQAAMGIGQMEQLDMFVRAKRRNYLLYKERLAACDFAYLHGFNEAETSNYWFYSLILNKPDPEKRDCLILFLQDKNVQTRPIWKLNHQQKPFTSYTNMDCCKSQRFYDSIINIPCSTNISEEQIDYVCACILSFK